MIALRHVRIEDISFMNNNFSGYRQPWWNQPHPQYEGGNSYNPNFTPNQPSLKDLVLSQVKINDALTKKLAANDKTLESINNFKLEGLPSVGKN